MQEPDVADRASVKRKWRWSCGRATGSENLWAKSMKRWSGSKTANTAIAKKTGDPIGVKRLEARPIATFSIEAQERRERKKRTQRDERE